MEKIFDLENYFYHRDDSIEIKEWIEFKLHKIDLNKDNQKYEFHIRDKSAKILLSDSYVQLKWRILKKNGNSIANENVTGVCGLNPFKSKKLTISNTTIEQVDNEFPIIQQLVRLGEYTPGYLSSSKPPEMFIFLDSKDTADRKKFIIRNDGSINAQTPVTEITDKLQVIENENYNKGFRKRCDLTKDSKCNTMWIPLNQIFDFLKTYQKVLTDFEIKIEFRRNSDENMLYTDVANPDYKVEFLDLSLFLTHIKLRHAAEVVYKDFLLTDKDINIYWNHYEITIINQIDKNNKGTYDLSASSDEVLRLFAIFQYTERDENIRRNNMIFDNLDMIECWYTVNGVPKPSEHYFMDFTNKEWNRLYDAFLEVTNNKSTETAPIVDYFKFGELYPIVCFDLSKHEDYTSLDNLTIKFNYKLRNGTNKAYALYLIAEVRKHAVLNMKKREITMINSLGK